MNQQLFLKEMNDIKNDLVVVSLCHNKISVGKKINGSYEELYIFLYNFNQWDVFERKLLEFKEESVENVGKMLEIVEKYYPFGTE